MSESADSVLVTKEAPCGGRGFFTVHPVRRGDCILSVKGWAGCAVNERWRGHVCAYCGKADAFRKVSPASAQLCCSKRGCETIRYCSPECMAIGLPFHRDSGECEAFRDLGAEFVRYNLPQNDRLSTRIVISAVAKQPIEYLHPRLAFEPPPVLPSDVRVGDLIALVDQFPPEQVEFMRKIFEFAYELSGVQKLFDSKKIDLAAFLRIFCAQEQNTFGIWHECELMGALLLPMASMYNHSCMPNVIRDIRLGTATVNNAGREERVPVTRFIALDDIPEGGECFISYVASDLPRELRQKELNYYLFKCACVRCRPTTEADPFSSVPRHLHSHRGECGGILFIEEDHMVCARCGDIVRE